MEAGEPISVNESTEGMHPEKLQEYLEGKLKELVRYAYEKAPGMKARFDEAGIAPSAVSTIKDLENVPILKKDDLIVLQRDNPPFGGLVAVPVEDLQRVYVSPGPIFDPHHSSEAYWRRHLQIISAIGFRKGDIVLNTAAYHLVPAGLLLDEVYKLAGVTVIPGGVGNTELQVQIMHRLKVTAFGGFTGFFMNVISKAEEMGYDIHKDFHLRLACIGGEMGGGPIRTLVEQKYGIPTRDFYGIAEAGLVAFECSEKSGMHIAQDVIIEIVDPASGKQLGPGEVGEIVITPIDETYPLIRFGTGDLSAMIYEPCTCGRTSPRLTRILGRVGDAVRTRGMFVHPKQFEPVLSKVAEISQYQMVVTRPGHRDELVLRAELKSEAGVEKEKLTEQLTKAVSEAVRIKVDKVEFVAPGVIPEEHKLIVDERAY